jgi:hypothetical protein
MLEFGHPAHEHFQDALGQVITVSCLKPSGMKPGVEEGGVKGDNPVPAFIARFTKLLQETQRSYG